jgi:hypothetical protein
MNTIVLINIGISFVYWFLAVKTTEFMKEYLKDHTKINQAEPNIPALICGIFWWAGWPAYYIDQLVKYFQAYTDVLKNII